MPFNFAIIAQRYRHADKPTMSASPPLVSIIVRTKDRPEMLAKATASALAQSHQNIELIIVNDGGAEVAESSFRSESGKGQTIKCINLPTNLGRSSAANAGLESALGDYIMFLDDDDWIEEEHVANLIRALQENPEYKAAYSATLCVEQSHEEWNVVNKFGFEYNYERLLIENFIPIHSVLFSKEVLGSGCKFDADFNFLEDWDFWLQVAQYSQFLFVNAETAYYRIATDSGFGTKEEGAATAQYRANIYKKWFPELSADALISILDKARQYPQLENVTAELREREKDLRVREGELARFKPVLEEKEKELEVLEKKTHKLELDLRDKESAYDLARHLIDQLSETLELMRDSKSWRYTRLMRRVLAGISVLKQKGIRSAFTTDYAALELASEIPKLRELQVSGLPEEYSPLAFPPSPKPLISIVIPVFNNHLYTFNCLRSIFENTSADLDYEVIVVDDCSEDETAEMLQSMAGLKVVSNDVNKGFIQSVNTGAEAATGEYLVILNNDTEVHRYWLTAMLETFDIRADVGMVGTKLVYPDGTLQEAGGIVWEDGSAWNYGRNDDAALPRYCYAREVDYCSGACLMLKKEDFVALGMFDSHYAPAYYEDTDLAFKIRKAGKKVFYQPNAVITHFEGISSGTDTGSGIKRYQVENQKKFFARWQEELRSHGKPGVNPDSAMDRSAKQNILVVDERMIMPDNDSGSLRMFNILKILINLDLKVSFITNNIEYKKNYSEKLQGLGIELNYHPFIQSVENFLQSSGDKFDYVVLSRVNVALNNIDDVAQYCPNAKIVFDTVDLHFLREEREAELTGDKKLQIAAQARKEQELEIARKSDITLVVSPVELELLNSIDENLNVHLLSNIHETYASKRNFKQKSDILFIGGFEHPPNLDAMIYFLDEVFPLIVERDPKLVLYILGSQPPVELLAKTEHSHNVVVTGFVSDIEPYFNRIRLSIAPLRFGAGVKGKINSSMSYGVPVVGTSVAVEGMGLVHGEDVLIGDSAEEFADQVLAAYYDESLWEKLSAGGRKNIEKHFSFSVAEEQLRAVLR